MLSKYRARLDIGLSEEGPALSVGNRMIKGGFAWLRRIGRNSRRKSESLAIQPCSLFLSTDYLDYLVSTHPSCALSLLLRVFVLAVPSFGNYPQSRPVTRSFETL